MSTPDIQSLVTRARNEILAALPDVVAIYVFGSAASGNLGPDSDLDLAVLGPRPYDGRQLYDLGRSIEVMSGVDIDLVDLITAPTLLKYEVITGGRQLHCAEPDVAFEFEGRSLAEYGRFVEDFAPLFDQIRDTGQAYSP
ncbi:MAG: nucleotidyltransferase domain-containing protein [Steroidobacteraceae bacterium]|nr:nucleotidyltransferase domain-containing protein [Steroidobacteraceae bacterium]